MQLKRISAFLYGLELKQKSVLFVDVDCLRVVAGVFCQLAVVDLREVITKFTELQIKYACTTSGGSLFKLLLLLAGNDFVPD